MYKNYLKIAWRNLLKNKVYSLINIIGLSIGLSASFVIGIMVYYDLTFDKFHPDKDRIYRITSELISPEGSSYNPGVSYPLGEALKENVPGIEAVARILTAYPLHVKNTEGDKLYDNPEYVVYADTEYFKTFAYDVLAGPTNLLNGPNELVLTKDRAQKYFPDTELNDMIGKTLIYQDTIPLKVTGVIADFKERTDLVFKEFISLETAQTADLSYVVTNNAGWNTTTSASQLFVKLDDNVSKKNIQTELDKLSKEHNSKDDVARGRVRKFYMQPLADLHLDPHYYIFDFSEGKASKSVLLSLGCIALFLLLLGCINFINLNTALATQRAKEIGIRKTLGSSIRQLLFQFLGETFLLTVAAALLSVFLSYWLLNVFSDFIPKGLTFSLFKSPVVLLCAVILLLALTFLSGFYPAMVLSRFKPVSVLKNRSLSKNDKVSIRKYLTVFQFCVAQIFVIATFLVGKQIHYMMAKDMGFKTEAIASVRTPWQEPDIAKRKLLAQRIGAIPMVSGTSLSSNPPASNSRSSSGMTYIDGENEIFTQLQLLRGDTNYLALYEIPLLAGRDRLNDSINEYVINDTYRKLLGFKTPQDAIGKFLGKGDTQYPIVGVVEDFNQRSLKTGIEPMAIVGDFRHSFGTVHFSFATNDTQSWPDAIADIEAVWNDIYPNSPFEVVFMDTIVQKFYEQEQKTATLLRWAMALSIAISCLGLFGLVVYTTERRTKEIGIRKILGASLVQLNLLLCKEFLVLVGVAFIIAAPLAYYGLSKWLEGFAYKTELSWWVFAASGIAMLFIAFMVMVARTLAKANANPVKSLRTE